MGNDGLNVRIAPRRAGGDTRRFFPAHRCACRFKGGLSAAVLPPPQLCTPPFARHCLRFPTQNRASGRFEGRNFWRFARESRFVYANWSIVVFRGNREKTSNCTGVTAATPWHRVGGGGSTLLHTRHHLPRPAPLIPDLAEARCTRHNFDKHGAWRVPGALKSHSSEGRNSWTGPVRGKIIVQI